MKNTSKVTDKIVYLSALEVLYRRGILVSTN